MNDLRNIDSDLSTLGDENLTKILLYGNHIYDDKANQIILMYAIRSVKDSQRFNELLFNPFWNIADFLHIWECFSFQHT